MGDPTAAARAVNAERRRTGRGLSDPNPGTRRLVGRMLMASPPTVTYGVTDAASSIASSSLIALTDSAFRLQYGMSTSVNPIVSNTISYYRSQITGLNAVANSTDSVSSFSFVCDADKFEVGMYAGNAWNMLVDGQWAFSSSQDSGKANGERYLTLIDFGSAGLREITIVGTLYVSGVRVGPQYRVYPPLSPAGPVVACLADSYGQQLNSLTKGGFATAACFLLGWNDLRLSAVGGTGYLDPNTNTGPYSTYRQRAQADVIDKHPDVIVSSGGINDQGDNSKAVLQAETTLLFAMLRAGCPTAPIVATGPWAPSSTLAASANYTDVRDAVKGGLATIAGPWLFVDNLSGLVTRHDGVTVQQQGPWITGTGKVGTINNTGNADRYTSADATHPSAVGSDYLGYRLAAAISAGLPL